MTRFLSAALLVAAGLLVTPHAFALCEPILQVTQINIYDTANRLANGQWILGSYVRMDAFDCFGGSPAMDWRTVHQIIGPTGYTAANTGTVTFSASRWESTIQGPAAFSICYHTSATAVVTFLGSSASQEAGSNELCMPAPPTTGTPPPEGGGCQPTETTTCSGPGGFYNYRECGQYNAPYAPCESPIVINPDSNDYPLSGTRNPVRFDLDADGALELCTWTAPRSSVAFLALDRNHNGTVDDGGELFGNHTPLGNGQVAANGFEALAVFDTNQDGRIDAADPIWPSLLLWTDRNHDARSTSDELRPIALSNVKAIYLQYRTSNRRDEFGNLFRYEGIAQLDRGLRRIYDVFFRVRD